MGKVAPAVVCDEVPGADDWDPAVAVVGVEVEPGVAEFEFGDLEFVEPVFAVDPFSDAGAAAQGVPPGEFVGIGAPDCGFPVVPGVGDVVIVPFCGFVPDVVGGVALCVSFPAALVVIGVGGPIVVGGGVILGLAGAVVLIGGAALGAEVWAGVVAVGAAGVAA